MMSLLLSNSIDSVLAASSPTLPSTTKPALPKRSHRRSFVGATPPPLSPSPPLSAPSPTITASTSMMTLSSNEVARPSSTLKRASTGTSTSMPSVAPLKFSSNKASRPVTADAAMTPPLAAQPSSSNSPFSAASTPTMPPKSRHRNSVHSPGSPPYPPISITPSITARSPRDDFVKGIGLDFDSPEPLSPSISTVHSSFPRRASSSRRSSTCMTHTSSSTSSKGIHAASASTFSQLDHTDTACHIHAKDDSSPTSLSSVATSIPDKSQLLLPAHAKSHDALFSRSRFAASEAFESAAIAASTPRRASLLTPVPMAISRSHQEMIDDSPNKFQRNEVQGIFDSVRGLIADLRFGMGHEPSNSTQPPPPRSQNWLDKSKQASAAGDGRDLASCLTTPHRCQADASREAVALPTVLAPQADESTPSIKVAVVQASSSPAASNEDTQDVPAAPAPQPTQHKLAPLAPIQIAKITGTEGGTSTGVRGLWGFLRVPSPSSKAAAMARSTSASSYSSAFSFVPRSTSSAVVDNLSASNLVSNSGFSLFSRKLTNRSASDTHASSVTQDDEIPIRLPRRQVDEDKLADLIISCADARHILKTDNSPAKLKEVGLKLELGWREQLAEAQKLRSRLEVTQDTVEDLEEENKHLRSQLGSLSEQIVSREEDMRHLGEATATQIARERNAAAVETEAVKADAMLKAVCLSKQLAEEKAFALGLGLTLREKQYHNSLSGLHAFREGSEQEADPSTDRSMDASQRGSLAGTSLGLAVSGAREDGRPPSVLFELAGDLEDPLATTADTFLPQLRRYALLQGRPNQSDASDDALGLAYEELFRCSVHRFAHGAAAPPSTLVDERVLLIGTDRKLLLALVQKLTALGLTQVLLATPVWSGSSPRAASASMRSRGVHCVSFDISADNAWATLMEEAISKLEGQIDCVVNAFDQLSIERLTAVSSLLKHQASARNGAVLSSETSTKQALSVVNVVYESQPAVAADVDGADTDAETTMCTMALIGLASTLAVQNNASRSTTSSQAVRFNTVVLSHLQCKAQSGVSRDNEAAVEGILRLVDPCSSVQGCVLDTVADMPARCLGAPLCAALPALFCSPSLSCSAFAKTSKASGLISRFAANDSNGHQWLKMHKRVADVELLDALEKENEALRKRLETIERSYAMLLEKSVSQSSLGPEVAT
ncbi:hypothetical protein NDA18_004834 [Ustilago nuda]|nr:hypothetical protein NDA18_004834 [Ustilago nuda]